jgi:small-conductance mechanosensitive channel
MSATLLRIAAVAALTAATAVPVLGQGQTAPVPARDTARAPRPTGAPVVLDNDTLFHLYGTLGPFSAADRAAAVSERLREMSRRIDRDTDTLRVVHLDSHSELVQGDAVLMTVLDADAAPLGRARTTVAAEYARTIEVATAEVAQDTTPRTIALGVVYAALATIALIILLRAIGAGFPHLYRKLEAIRRVRMPALRIQQFELVSAERLSQLLLVVARAARIAITLVLFYLYVPFVLSFFPWTVPLSRRIVGYAIAPLAAVWNGFIDYVPNLFYMAVIVLVTRYVLKLVHTLFRAIEHGAITLAGFYPDWAEPTYKIVRVLILAFAAVVIFPYLPGAHTDAFKGVSIFLGILFSLGSSSAISNVVAGVVLTYTRAFRIGDRVRIGETIGDITEKTLLVTRVRTIKNVEITIPNGTVLSSQVVNYTTLAADRGLILHTTVTIGYDAPWPRVHELLIAAARRTANVLSEPEPFVFQTSLNDFYVSYELNAFTDRPDLMAVTYSQLHQSIQDSFNEGGVEIMSPHYGALRDGNATTIPAAHLGKDYRAPAFRVAAEASARE